MLCRRLAKYESKILYYRLLSLAMCHHILVDVYRLSREGCVSTVNDVKILNYFIGDFRETNFCIRSLVPKSDKKFAYFDFYTRSFFGAGISPLLWKM
jgi:hypothetical protein